MLAHVLMGSKSALCVFIMKQTNQKGEGNEKSCLGEMASCYPCSVQQISCFNFCFNSESKFKTHACWFCQKRACLIARPWVLDFSREGYNE